MRGVPPSSRILKWKLRVISKHDTAPTSRLPPDILEGMRFAYQRCEPFLSTLALAIEEMSVVKKAIKVLQTIGEQ